MDQDRKSPAWLWPVAGVVAVVALVIIGMNRPPVELDPDSPAGVVQQYVEALDRGDYETAAGFWAESTCRPESIVPNTTSDISVSLLDVEMNGERATVTVLLSEASDDPMGGLYEYQEWFNLVNENGDWRIEQPAWPYYDQLCEGPA